LRKRLSAVGLPQYSEQDLAHQGIEVSRCQAQRPQKIATQNQTYFIQKTDAPAASVATKATQQATHADGRVFGMAEHAGKVFRIGQIFTTLEHSG
jgi:hypothetical protein